MKRCAQKESKTAQVWMWVPGRGTALCFPNSHMCNLGSVVEVIIFSLMATEENRVGRISLL